jgi:hypothetical protein
MKSGKDLWGNRSACLVVAVAGLCFSNAHGQEVQHLSVIQQGGMPGWPLVTGIERVTNGVKVTWDGPSGYYQLHQRANLNQSGWQKVGGLNSRRNVTLTNVHGNAFFKVSGPSPNYAGAQACIECHQNIHTEESLTRHADAFTDPRFVAKGGQTNSACLPCHTVGYGLPTGFVSKEDANTNPRLAGVQCESCHGPAANHAANEFDFSVRPRAEIASTVCGGCHNEASHRPHYEEWSASGHAIVTEDMNPPDRINRCGRCHSGSSRLALLKGQDPAVTVTNDANVSITCVLCHDPHGEHAFTNFLNGVFTAISSGLTFTNQELGEVYTNQLRNPVNSTKDYFLTTSDVFSNKYDPNINVCAQCHNHRGAAWSSTSRPPHHSPQYNVLLGTIGELPPGSLNATNRQPGTHSLVEKQCVACHMPTTEPSEEQPVAPTGHKFAVDAFDACLSCHPTTPELLLELTQDFVIKPRIQDVKLALDFWATNSAPEALRSKYGVLAWEYTNPGDLSVGSPGPSEIEQGLIPVNIKKARFNLYLIEYDGSYGVHNPFYSINLLDTALAWVWEEVYE